MVLALICSMGVFADNWYFNGNAAPGGWSDNSETNQTRAFTEDAQGNLVWIGKLVTGGEGFKIGRNGNDFGGWGDVHPSTPGLDITAAGTDNYVEGGDDTKWTVSEDGIYKLTLDPAAGTLTCEAYTPTIQEVDGWYEVGTAEQLYEFAELVSHNAIPSNCSVRLTANIEFEDYHYTTIGRSGSFPFKGTFDGQGHYIEMDLKDIYGRTGLFGYINIATIKNLTVSGTVTMEHHNCGGGLGGRSDGDGTKIENVFVQTDIYYTHSNGDATVGGFFANMEGNVLLKNCLFTGTIDTGTAEGNGGLIGWAGGGSRVSIQNCLVMPFDYTKNGNSAEFARNNPSVENCYYVTDSDARLRTGELCYLLNGKVSGGENWLQNLSSNLFTFPIPAHAHSYIDALTPNIVYANGVLSCDGSAVEGAEVVYSNVNESVIPDHSFADGWCSVCGHIDENFITPVDGVYSIANVAELKWFSGMVAAGHQTINAVLAEDIAMTAADAYVPVGTDAKPFKGQFDGRFHTVDLYIDKIGEVSRQGLFGTLSGDATISNVTVKGYVGAKEYAGGIAGAVQNAGTVTFDRCGNEADIEASGANAGGIVGCNFSGKVVVKNCYNVGDIVGDRESAGISGWLGNNAVVENTYNAGEVYGVDGTKTFARWGSGTYTNCYNTLDANTLAGRTDSYPMEKVASGELCVALGEAFYQNLGEDEYPVLDPTHKKVYFINEEYTNEWESAFNADMYYTITNKIKTDAYWHDAGTDNILCYAKGQVEDYYWTLVPSVNINCYYIKNVNSGRYVQAHGTQTEVEIALGETPAEYNIAFCEAESAYGFASVNNPVYNFTANCVGLNLKKDPNEEGCCVQTYAAVAGTNHRSFWLIESVDPVTTGINAAVVAPVKVVKTIENGQIVIIRNGVKYNVAGAQMK